MSSAKHTPGPWRVDDDGKAVRGNIGWWSVLIASTPTWASEPAINGAANARLISAAPDLLEALRALVIWSDPDHPDSETMAKDWGDRLSGMGVTPTSRKVRECLMDAACAAVAKAEGR